MTPYELLKAIYNKTDYKLDKPDISTCILLNKWLSYEPCNLLIVKSLIPLMFYIEPENYIKLLYIKIPKKYKFTFYKKSEKEKIKEDKLVKKIQYILNWSDKDLDKNSSIIEILLKDRKHLEFELGI